MLPTRRHLGVLTEEEEEESLPTTLPIILTSRTSLDEPVPEAEGIHMLTQDSLSAARVCVLCGVCVAA